MTLEQDLRGLAGAFPETPQLAPGVLRRMQRASARRTRRRVLVLALALLVLVPASALAVSPGLRDRVLRTFGLRGVSVRQVAHLPAVGPEARRLQLGTRVSLRQAQTALGVPVQPPSALGAPDGIFRQDLRPGTDVSLLYEPATVAARQGVRERVLVSLLRGRLQDPLLQKTLSLATHVTRLRIDGGRALLITGPPHLFLVFAHEGTVEQAPIRLAGSTLLWQRGPLILRVEGNLPGPRLVAIARSISTD
jgi:hypothetical protein